MKEEDLVPVCSEAHHNNYIDSYKHEVDGGYCKQQHLYLYKRSCHECNKKFTGKPKKRNEHDEHGYDHKTEFKITANPKTGYAYFCHQCYEGWNEWKKDLELGNPVGRRPGIHMICAECYGPLAVTCGNVKSPRRKRKTREDSSQADGPTPKKLTL